MIQRTLSLPEIGLIAVTRVALGLGIGLLVAGRLRRNQRRSAGLALTLVGALTTIPFVMRVIGSGRGASKKTLWAA
jgi:hypothetical protein